MVNPRAEMQLKALQTVDAKPENAEFISQEYFLRDVIAVPPSKELVPTRIFLGSDSKDEMYRSEQFPSGSQAFKITHVAMTTDILFEVATPKEQREKLTHFINYSELLIRKDGNEIARIPVREMMDVSVVTGGGDYVTEGSDTVYLATKIRSKFNNRYKLMNEIAIPAGQKLDITFVPAKGLKTYANGLFHPNLGLQNDKGFIIDITFSAIKIAGTAL